MYQWNCILFLFLIFFKIETYNPISSYNIYVENSVKKKEKY